MFGCGGIRPGITRKPVEGRLGQYGGIKKPRLGDGASRACWGLVWVVSCRVILKLGDGLLEAVDDILENLPPVMKVVNRRNPFRSEAAAVRQINCFFDGGTDGSQFSGSLSEEILDGGGHGGGHGGLAGWWVVVGK